MDGPSGKVCECQQHYVVSKLFRVVNAAGGGQMVAFVICGLEGWGLYRLGLGLDFLGHPQQSTRFP